MNFEIMKNLDIKKIDRSELVDIANVQIKNGASGSERFQDYVSQIKNPYFYKDGKIVVKLSFADTGRTIEDCFAQYLQEM